MYFDGSKYRVVDDSLIASDEPMDARLHIVEANNLTRAQNAGDRASVAYFLGENTSRPATTVNYTCIAAFPTRLDSRHTAVKVDLLATVDNRRGGEARVDLRLEVWTAGQKFKRNNTLVETDANPATLSPWSIRCPVSVASATQATVTLWARAGGALLGNEHDTVDDIDYKGRILAPGFYEDQPSATTQPLFESLDTSASYIVGFNPSDLGLDAIFDRPKTADHICLAPDEIPPAPRDVDGMYTGDTPASSGSFAGVITVALDFIQIESLHLTREVGEPIRRPPSAYRGGVPEAASQTIFQVNTQQREYERDRLISIGPRGEDNPGVDQWPVGYRKAWPTIDGDDAVTEMLSDHVHLRREVTSVSFTGIFAAAWTPRIDPLADKEEVEERQFGSTWDLKFSANQFEDGEESESEIFSSETSEIITTYPASQGRAYPFLLGAYAARWDDTDDAGYRWVYSDGHLWPDDFDLMQRFRISLGLDLDNYDDELPLRLALTAEMDSADFGALDGFGDDFYDDGLVRLYLIGYSITAGRSS